MPSPRLHDSFSATIDDNDESTTLSDVYQEFGMRPASLRASTTPTIQTQRLSNLSSISEWSRQTIGCMQSTDLSWVRLEDDTSRYSRSLRGGGDKYIDLDAQARSAGGTTDSTTSPRLTALPRRRVGRFSEAEDITIFGDADPQNPAGWKRWKKWVHVVVLSNVSFVASMGSLILAPAAPEVAYRMQIQSPLLLTFIVSIYVLGFATGPLLMAPFSELYGRLLIIHLSNWCFVGFTVACGFSQTKVQLLVLRFFASALGTACLSLGGAIVSDIFQPGQRAVALATLEASRLLGWFVGPIVGGIISQSLFWRWIFWILAASAGFNSLLSAVVLRETYAPIVMQRRVARTQSEKRTLTMHGHINSAISPSTLLRRSILLPLKMLCLEPLVMLTSLYSATLSAILIVIATTIPFTYSRDYGFSEWKTGLVYIAPGIGMILGLLIAGFFIDCMSKRRRMPSKAEHRISIIGVLAGSTLAGGGLALYGWTMNYRYHWIIPLVGLAVFGFGLLPLTTCMQSYLTEAYSTEEAGVMAANSIMRSLASGLLPLCGLVIYSSIGFGWGHTLLAGILGISILIPIFCKLWGEKLRQRFRVDT